MAFRISAISADLCRVFESVGIFFNKANDYFILFLECILKKKWLFGSLEIMADTSNDVINMAPIKNLKQSQVIIIVSIRVFVVWFLVNKHANIA